MKKHIDYLHALIRNALQKLRRKMQPCCRSGSGTVFTSIDRLIAFLILQLLRDIRRQRHFTDPIQNFFQYAVIIKLDYLVPVIEGINNGGGKLRTDCKGQTGLCSPSGLCKAFPFLSLKAFEEQKLHRSARILAATVDSGRDDPCIVSDEYIAGVQIVDYIGEYFILYLTRTAVIGKKP